MNPNKYSSKHFVFNDLMASRMAMATEMRRLTGDLVWIMEDVAGFHTACKPYLWRFCDFLMTTSPGASTLRTMGVFNLYLRSVI